MLLASRTPGSRPVYWTIITKTTIYMSVRSLDPFMYCARECAREPDVPLPTFTIAASPYYRFIVNDKLQLQVTGQGILSPFGGSAPLNLNYTGISQLQELLAPQRFGEIMYAIIGYDNDEHVELRRENGQLEIRSNNRYCPISQKSIQLGNQASEMQYTQMFFDSVVTMTNSTPILNPSGVVDLLEDAFAVV